MTNIDDKRKISARTQWREVSAREFAESPALRVNKWDLDPPPLSRLRQECKGIGLIVETFFLQGKPVAEIRTRYGPAAGACGRKFEETFYLPA